jgi:hypothetical protein
MTWRNITAMNRFGIVIQSSTLIDLRNSYPLTQTTEEPPTDHMVSLSLA